jgi:hypothetical protein
VSGLATGFYHYQCTDHALTRPEGGAAPAQEMLASARDPPCEPPQCLIVLASRLPRLAWKYEANAYNLSLMNAGVVLQSLYLVCTGLGLNGAAGSGRPLISRSLARMRSRRVFRFNQEAAPTALATDEGEAQEVEGFRFAEPALACRAAAWRSTGGSHSGGTGVYRNE